MRDLFERFRVPSESRATRATGATGVRKASDSGGLPGAEAVAHGSAPLGNMGNTPSGAEGAARRAQDAATRRSTDVAPLPKQSNTWATRDAVEKPKQDKAFPQPLPMLPMLPSENDTVDNVERTLALLAETFERIAAWWVAGARLPVRELETDIDRAVLAGDLGALRAALGVYEQAARESCAQHRWRRRCYDPVEAPRVGHPMHGWTPYETVRRAN